MTHTTVIDGDEPSYMAPEGFYLATLHTHTKGPNKKKENKLRLRFELEVPKCSGVRFMAGRSFNPNLSEGSDLHWFLKVWLGEEKLNQFLKSGADFDQLIGERGIAEIKHIYDKQPKPFVNLESMRPVDAVRDSVTVNVPKVVKATITASSTATASKSVPAAVPIAVAMTATASTCPYCGAEVNKFGAVR